ncbi:MAG: TonB family protein [Verrucomicrobiales bacterium]|nr:TonB family protein [Verrucomicrobiales bacterium]
MVIAFFATSFQQQPELETAPLIELVSVETPPKLIDAESLTKVPAAAAIPPPLPKKVEEPKPVVKVEKPKVLAEQVQPVVAPIRVAIIPEAKAKETTSVSSVPNSPSVTSLSPETTSPAAISETAFAPGVTAQPRYRENPEPAYPPSAKRRREEGTVVLSVAVTATGSPEAVVVKESSGFAALDDAAKNAVRNWKFEPARSTDQPVASKVEVPVRFQLSK